MFGLFLGQRVTGLGIVRVDQFIRRKGRAAFLALVAIRTEAVTTRTLTADIPIGKEMTGGLIEELLGSFFYELSCIIHFAEVICSELMVNVRRGTRIDVKRYAEIREGALDQFVIPIYHLLGSDAFFACPDSDGYAMFV